MAALQLNFLGDIEVLRDGVPVALPPSKKTRALLAYLALNPRSFRRERLCELLWEIPDDPRGSLRWSLSKLRRLVDDDDRRRIVADRTSVAFDGSDVRIDLVDLRALAENGLDAQPLEVLEEAARRYRGNLLEGLELSNFHDFHSWWVSEREAASRLQAQLLGGLVDRLGVEEERALPYARSLVGLAPYDETARAGLIRRLVALRRGDEAEQQYRLGMRMMEEVGARSSGELYQAWRGAPASTSPRVAAARPAAPPVSMSESLLGRDAEFARLADAFARATAEPAARVVLLRGDPGIGKSRLLAAAREMAGDGDAFVLEAGAFQSETIRPFALWLDAFRRLDPEAAARVFTGVDQDNRDRLFAALSDVVANETRDRPVVVVFDDLQWCDESSAAALHYVARMNRARPLFAVVASRDDELRDNAGVQQALRGLRHDGLLQEIRLGPLSEAAVCSLIEERAPDADSERLSRECAGNPLLAIELARAESVGDSGNSLDELVRERLARFDVEGSEILRWAAVLNPRLDLDRLVQVTGMDTIRVGQALETAERQAMLRSVEHGFRFSHDLVARAVYTDISPARRRVMHRRVAEVLERATAVDLEHAADLAHHAAHSGEPGLASRAMISAGRLCLRFFANDDALALARRGLLLAEQLSDAERVRVTLDLREIMMSAAPVDDWESAADEYVALAEQALDHGALAHARLGYHMASYLRWAHGHWAGAHEQTLQAERVTRGGSDEEHIVGMAETAKCLAMLEKDLDQADAMLMEAQALATRGRVSHHAIPAALGMLRYQENRLDEAEELLMEARTLCKSAGDRVSEYQANEYLAMIDVERGDFRAASARCNVLMEIGRKLRVGSEAPFARAMLCLCSYGLADDATGLDEAIDELRVVDAKHRLAYVLIRAALVDLERGRPAEAAARASQALEHAVVLQRATETLMAHLVLALACRAVDDEPAASSHAAAARELLALPTVAGWARNRAAEVVGG